MIGLWALAVAAATDLSSWAGDWALDPSQSDDPGAALQRAISAPLVSSGAARGLAPDGGQDDREQAQRRLVEATSAMLGQSGRIALAPTDDGDLEVTFGGDAPLVVALGRRWTKVKRPDEGLLRIRAEVEDHLVLERRHKTLALTETFLIPTEPEIIYVVVRIDGSGIEGLEFRRVYRALHADG